LAAEGPQAREILDENGHQDVARLCPDDAFRFHRSGGSVHKPARAPDSSHIIERLGASPTTTGSERRDHGPSRQRSPAQTDA